MLYIFILPNRFSYKTLSHRLFDELKLQHDTEKSKFTAEMDTLKASIQAKNEEISQLKDHSSEHQKVYDRLKDINEFVRPSFIATSIH